MKFTRTCLTMTLIACASVANAEEAKNLLFFGNSFTQSGGGVQRIIRDIAVSAGHPRPYVFSQAIGGVTLEYHLANSTSVITSGIAPGDHWDNVVLQEYSTRPTFNPNYGNVPAFLAAADGLYQATLNHSPDAQAVMFETWARGPGHFFYPTEWPDPATMQSELRTNYHLCVDNLNADYGPGSAKYAPVGDGFENGSFDLSLYAGDIYHASNRGALLISLILYGTIYDDMTTSDIDLTAIAAGLGLGQADIDIVTTIADETLVPAPGAVAMLVLGGAAASRRRR
ncbi:MAG: hypothetical protein H6810_03045 [Phycisphaeraceae bacterium]|nr:MAG: hypothetical protein H6810_03045 [Phycisphaeraceae bacterium]